MTRKHQREAGENRDRGEEKTLESRSAEATDGQRPKQPRPKVPLLSRGKDPTLAEHFEEELHGSPRRAGS